MLMPRWFLLLNGVALLLMGGAMLVARLRQKQGAEPRGRPGAMSGTKKMMGILWALLCCGIGALLLTMATGTVRQPGDTVQTVRHQGPVFPTDR